jgi:hypothetical protein
MKICPACNQEAQVLITNVQTGQQFCHNCSSTACPTFLPHLIFTKDDVRLLRAMGVDSEVSRIEDHLRTHCKRNSGTERAWFRTREEAEAFAQDPNNPAYHGDLARLCWKCDYYHLSQPSWLEPVLTARDAQFLEDIGVTAPQRMDDYFRRVYCGTVQRDGIEFLILEDGKMVCGAACRKMTDFRMDRINELPFPYSVQPRCVQHPACSESFSFSWRLRVRRSSRRLG